MIVRTFPLHVLVPAWKASTAIPDAPDEVASALHRHQVAVGSVEDTPLTATTNAPKLGTPGIFVAVLVIEIGKKELSLALTAWEIAS